MSRFNLQTETHFGGREIRCYVSRSATLDGLFRATAAAHAGREALVCDDTRLTYAELDARIDRFATALSGAGVARGARIAVLLDNVPEFIVAVLGAIRAGMIAVPMNVRQAARETAFVLGQSGAEVLVCADAAAPQLPQTGDMPGVRRVLAVDDGSFDRFCEVAGPMAAPVQTGEEDCICLLYTSGTTGRPKGAMLTNLGMVHSAMGFHDAFALDEEDVTILSVPASHVTGLEAVLLAVLTSGGKVVMTGKFRAATFLDLADREGLTYAMMVPAMYNLCLLEPALAHADLGRWRIAAFGGAPMPPSSIERMAKFIPHTELRNTYGATETTSPTSTMPEGAFHDHADSVGRPLPYADVSVVDDAGQPVAVGVIGEILIGGPMVVRGYWDNPDADAKEFDPRGRWKSGDLGFLDEAGFLHIADRRKDIVNRGGYKIYCIEVEAILSQFDGVLEAAVVAMPDPVLGEKTLAFVHTGGAGIDLEALSDHARRNLSSYKVPDRVIVSDDPLPRNANGKIVKAELRTQVPVASAAP